MNWSIPPRDPRRDFPRFEDFLKRPELSDLYPLARNNVVVYECLMRIERSYMTPEEGLIVAVKVLGEFNERLLAELRDVAFSRPIVLEFSGPPPAQFSAEKGTP